jgi:hypothetical protein
MKIKLLFLLFVTLIFSSCAKFPQNKIDETSAYLDSLKTVDCEIFLPQTYTSLVSFFDSVKNTANQEKEKWFSNYDDVLKSLDSISGTVYVNFIVNLRFCAT